MLLVVAQFRLEPHYAVALMAPLAVLAALAWSIEGRSVNRLHRAGRAAFVLASVAMATLGLVGLAVLSQGLQNAAQVAAVSQWLKTNVTADSSLFVWGNEPELYVGSGLDPASRFVYVYPVLTPGFADQSLVDEVVGELAAARPAFVVDAGSTEPGVPGIVPLLVPRPAIGDRTYDVIDSLREFVAANFGPPVEVSGWLIYPATSW
jgi:hypothetical protein